MNYPLAETFSAPQGEGLYTGTQMLFVRTVGCSVGKGVCHACDTTYERIQKEKGGGTYQVEDIVAMSGDHRHVCVTGGEPLDRDLRPLLLAFEEAGKLVHVETSGTRHPEWLDIRPSQPRNSMRHAVGFDRGDTEGRLTWRWMGLWLTVSPKPGYKDSMIEAADEVKVILGGLGDGPGWPTVKDAVRWADNGKLVYVQPRNHVSLIAEDNMLEALDVVARHPQLRLSVQMHKYLRTR